MAPPFRRRRRRPGARGRRASERRSAARLPGRCRRPARRSEIVCGAPNVRAGIKVPCALVGAELPPAGRRRRAVCASASASIRGVESRGMLCSARELRLSDDHGGLLVLDDAAPVGADLRAVLRLDDTIFTLKLTPNLGHCLSVFGVAREVAALTGAPLRAPAFAPAPVDRRRDAAGRDRGRRPVRPLLRPRHPRRRPERADAGVDGRAARALRPARRSRRSSTSRTT